MPHRLTIKGQVTIPKEIRDFLGLEEGNSCVEFAVKEDGTVTVRKAQAAGSPKFIRRSAPRHAKRVELTSRMGVLTLLAGGMS